MEPTDPIARYRRYLKRRNYWARTVKNYIHILGHFSAWLQIPIEQVTSEETVAYINHLLRWRKKPKTISCHLDGIHAFYHYLIEDERMPIANPVKRNYRLRLPLLPKHLRDEQIGTLQRDHVAPAKSRSFHSQSLTISVCSKIDYRECLSHYASSLD